MKAEELRIGNWVLDAECEPYYFQVEQISKFVGYDLFAVYRNGSIKTKEPEPIPLTEEWLVKFGFEKVDHIHGYSFWSLSKSKINKCHINVYEHTTTWMGYNIKHVKYVHQLQNLYFALTGEELTIKTDNA